MRIIAALCAFLFCVFYGFKKSRELKTRVDFLNEITLMLNNFSAEIRFGSPELSELISRENNRFSRLVKDNCTENTDIKDAWENACGQLPKSAEETALLRELLTALSGVGSDGAVMTLAMYSERFSRLEKQASEEYLRKGKALKKIGALCGFAAAILII